MKVMQLLPELNSGGVERGTLEIARALVAAGHEIIAMKHSFHGRSIGALSVTGNAHYQEPFEPLMGGVRFADFNDLESVKAQITDKTCAIITETVMTEWMVFLI